MLKQINKLICEYLNLKMKGWTPHEKKLIIILTIFLINNTIFFIHFQPEIVELYFIKYGEMISLIHQKSPKFNSENPYARLSVKKNTNNIIDFFAIKLAPSWEKSVILLDQIPEREVNFKREIFRKFNIEAELLIRLSNDALSGIMERRVSFWNFLRTDRYSTEILPETVNNGRIYKEYLKDLLILYPKLPLPAAVLDVGITVPAAILDVGITVPAAILDVGITVPAVVEIIPEVIEIIKVFKGPFNITSPFLRSMVSDLIISNNKINFNNNYYSILKDNFVKILKKIWFKKDNSKILLSYPDFTIRYPVKPLIVNQIRIYDIISKNNITLKNNFILKDNISVIKTTPQLNNTNINNTFIVTTLVSTICLATYVYFKNKT